DGLSSAGLQQRLDDGEGGFHRAASKQEVGNEKLVGFKAPADFIHGRNHALVDERNRLDAVLGGAGGERGGCLGIAPENGIEEWVHGCLVGLIRQSNKIVKESAGRVNGD